MIPRTLALLALLLGPAAGESDDAPLPAEPAVAAHVLSSARKDLKVARDDLKSLSPDERAVVKAARGAIADTARWRSVAPTFGAAADLLEAAGAGTGPTAEMCVHMARSFRAMADEIDKDASYLGEDLREKPAAERADATYAAAEKLLAAAAAAKFEELAAEGWGVLARSDPQFRALALNVKTLGRGFATLSEKEHAKAPGEVIAKAAKLQEAMEACFSGIRTSRAAPEPPPAPKTEPKRYRIKVRMH